MLRAALELSRGRLCHIHPLQPSARSSNRRRVLVHGGISITIRCTRMHSSVAPITPTEIAHPRRRALPAASSPTTRLILLLMLLALIAMIFGVLILGPSDLYDKD